jgi:hypothetical protein
MSLVLQIKIIHVMFCISQTNMINNKLKIDDMHVIKYIKDIGNIVKHVCYCR